jgi:type IV fimbrial biogenesis protein FimT
MTPCCSRVPLKSPKPAAGFTLIEVLVAMLVMSLGRLGAAGMQVASLRAKREARAPSSTSHGHIVSASKRRSSLRGDSGVTLIELMTVLAVLAILSSLAAPSLREFLIRNRSAAISNEFVATILRARNEAVNRNMCVTVCRSTLATTPAQCNAGSNWQTGWIAFANASCNAAASAPAADDIFVQAGPLDPSFSLVSSATNADRILFSPSGNARTGDAGRFDLQYRDETRSSNRGICLSVLGRTRMVSMGGTC